MKVAIIGSRTYNNYAYLSLVLNSFNEAYPIDLIISGGAKGADSLAEKYAKEHNIQTQIFKPDWNKYGKRAGFIRNEDIIKNCDCVIAFWDGQSKGTKHSLDLADKYNKPKIIKPGYYSNT